MRKTLLFFSLGILLFISCRKSDSIDITTSARPGGNGGGGSTINLTQGLVAFYPFNGNANDASGNNNNGIVTGATLTRDRYNKINKAYAFDPSSRITIPHSNQLNISSGFSISLWYLSGSTNFAQDLVMKGNDSQLYSWWIRHHSFAFSDSNVNFAYINPFAGRVQIRAAYPPLNQWTNIVGTVEGTKMRVYKNGILTDSTSNVDFSNSSSNNSDLIFGSLQYSFSGKLDDIRIYNRALNQAEITYLARN